MKKTSKSSKQNFVYIDFRDLEALIRDCEEGIVLVNPMQLMMLETYYGNMKYNEDLNIMEVLVDKNFLDLLEGRRII